MCLIIDEAVKDRFIKKAKFGKVTCWKYIYKDNDSIYMNFQWKKGLNKSSRKNIRLSEAEKTSKEVRLGFHVFLNRDDARNCESGIDRKLIKLTCNLKDLVTAGYYCGYPNAVFKQVTY